MNVAKTVWIIVVCLLITLAVSNLGQFITIRVVVQNHQNQLMQIQQAINQRDQKLNRMIGQLKSAKTMGDVEKALATVQ